MLDAIVIGSGIVGAAVAFRLSQAGARVTVLEATRPAALASRFSFAWINASHKPPRPYHDLNAAGVAEHQALAVEIGGDWLHPTGRLEWATSQPARAALQDNITRLRAWDYPVERIDQEQAQALVPTLCLSADGEADYAFHPEEGWIEGATLIGHLLPAAEATGAMVVYPAPVERLLVEGGGVTGVLAAGATYRADVVIDCAGVAAGTLPRDHGLSVAQRRSPGLLIVTEPASAPLDRVVHAPGVYLRPDGGGRLLIGSEEIDASLTDLPPDAPAPAVDTEPCQELLRRARALVPRLTGVEVESARLCWRPMPTDGLSAVGPIADLPGYYIALTHSGITLGPLLGRLVASEIAAGQFAPELLPFRPDRLVERVVGGEQLGRGRR